MSSRRKITLPDHVRRAVLAEVAMDYKAWQEAEARFKRRLYLATEQGVYGEEIAEAISASPGAVSKWKGQGQLDQQAREISRDGSPGRSGEREPVG